MRLNGDPLRQLAEEHVVPEGLGGTLTIRLASCRCCETAINAFEQPILKTILYAPRISMGVKRKRRKRPKDLFHIRGNVDGKEVEVDLPVEEIPVLLFLLQLGPPGICAVARLKRRRCTGAGFSICLAIGAWHVENTAYKT
jgi:hypothetical protein